MPRNICAACVLSRTSPKGKDFRLRLLCMAVCVGEVAWPSQETLEFHGPSPPHFTKIAPDTVRAQSGLSRGSVGATVGAQSGLSFYGTFL